jgi:anti-anti-sigma factor
MVGRPFSATVEPRGDDAVLRMTGAINRLAANGLDKAFRNACRTGAARIGLDFTDVDYLNSTGIALIVGILREARSTGVAMAAWGLSAHFREIFEITRIVEFMPIHDNEAAALAAG